MNFDKVTEMVMELAALKFFPPANEPDARLALVRMVGEWAKSEDEVRGLVDKMLELDEWPGPREFHKTFNRLYRPSSVLPERVPFPTTPLPEWFTQWSAGLPELPSGDESPAPTDEQLAEWFKDLCAKRSMPGPRPRANIHTLPAVPRAPYTRTPEEQAELDQIEKRIQELTSEKERAEIDKKIDELERGA